MKLKHLNILLAEDDKDDHYFFATALKELEASVHLTTLNDGVKLLNYLSENAEQLPDIIFLDLNMNYKNGFECLCEINADEKLKHISVVILSSSFPQDKTYELGMINHLFKLGACAFIRKPDNPVQLKHVILHALYMATENTGLKYILNV